MQSAATTNYLWDTEKKMPVSVWRRLVEKRFLTSQSSEVREFCCFFHTGFEWNMSRQSLCPRVYNLNYTWIALPKTKLDSAVEKWTAVDKMIHVKDYLQDSLLSSLKFFVPHLRFLVMSQDHQEKSLLILNVLQVCYLCYLLPRMKF